ncbi:hypothetical protein [Listeria costaricensis]|uniref:hypothetical protein n=1 Tax=Listeria costaricensis TaxID=2026604 RepID=UPI000C0827A3|nr:hypothetical protein [Listeria costaricensis]
MNKTGKFEMMFFPTSEGTLKIHVYGFNPCGSWGEVYVNLGEETLCVKGFNRQKTIQRAIATHQEMKNNRKMNDR